MMLFSDYTEARDSKYIKIPNGVIHYRSFGKGNPIVIINGGPGMNSEGFADLAEKLSNQGFHCIIYDQRGTGKSEMKKVDSTTITMKNMIEDLEVLRKHLNIKKWTVFGQSFGGLLTAQYAQTHPQVIDKLVFSNSGGLNLEFMQYVGSWMNDNLLQIERDSLAYYDRILGAQSDNQHIRYRRARQLASAYVYDKKHIPAIAERLTQVNIKINSLVFQDLQKSKFNYVDKFKNFKRPVLIFQGLNDIISIDTAQKIKSAFSGSKLIALDKCGHYPWLDRPDIFWKELVGFL